MTFKTSSRLTSLLGAVLGMGAAVLAATPAQAAERVTVRWSGTDINVSVADLTNFAQQRPVSADLRSVLSLVSPEIQQDIREALVAPVPISANSVQQIVQRGDTFSIFLTRLGNVIRPEPPIPLDNPAIATAIQTAAQSPQGLSFLGVIQAFPSETLLFDLNTFVTYLQQVNEQLLATEAIVNRLKQSNQTSSTDLQRLQAAGPNPVQVQTFSWRDAKRNRPVPTDLYLPKTTAQKLPLVVISHGLGESRQTFVYLARHLASHGYAVAVPEHVTTSAQSFENILVGISSPPGAQALIDIPSDTRFVLDQLAATPAIAGRVQTDKAAIIGHSYGGYAALAVAGAPLSPLNARQGCEPLDRFRNNLSTLLQCIAVQLPQSSYSLKDPRIVAAIAADGLSSDVFGAASLSQVQVPTLIWGGTRDVVTPALPEAITAFRQLGSSQKWLALAVNGTHFTVMPPNEKQPRSFQIPLPPELIGPNQAVGNQIFQGLTLAFLNQTLRGQASSLPSGSGTTAIATPELKVLLTQQVP